MEVKTTVTLKQIYQVLCPECQEKLLDLAAQSAGADTIKQNLKQQLEAKGD